VDESGLSGLSLPLTLSRDAPSENLGIDLKKVFERSDYDVDCLVEGQAFMRTVDIKEPANIQDSLYTEIDNQCASVVTGVYRASTRRYQQAIRERESLLETSKQKIKYSVDPAVIRKVKKSIESKAITETEMDVRESDETQK
jgi:hypothetical protein